MKAWLSINIWRNNNYQERKESWYIYVVKGSTSVKNILEASSDTLVLDATLAQLFDKIEVIP